MRLAGFRRRRERPSRLAGSNGVRRRTGWDRIGADDAVTTAAIAEIERYAVWAVIASEMVRSTMTPATIGRRRASAQSPR